MKQDDERDFFWSVGIVVFLLLAVTVLMRCDPAHAQDLPEVPDVTLPEVGETAALERGDRAPWAGMLVRDEDLFALQAQAFTLTLSLRNAEARVAEAAAGQARVAADAARLCDERLQLHVELWRDRRDELTALLEEARTRAAAGPDWYEHPALWFAIGGAVVGALVIGIAAAIGGG
jgi:hypothetical protein